MPLRRGPAAGFASAASLRSTSAPALSSTRTTSIRPSRTAKSSGVNPDLQRASEVGPGLDEQLDDLGVPVGRRPHQRGLALAVLRVHLRPGVEQRLHRPDAAGAGGGHQGRLAAAQRGVRVGAGRRAAARRSPRCRSCRPATAASRRSGSRPSRRRRPRAAASPSPGRRDRPPSAGPSCRRPGRRSTSALSLEQRADARPVGLLGGVGQRALCGAAAASAIADDEQRSAEAAARTRCASDHRTVGSLRSRSDRQRLEQLVDLAAGCRRTSRGGRRPCRAASGAGWPAASACRSGCAARPSCRRPRRRRRGSAGSCGRGRSGCPCRCRRGRANGRAASRCLPAWPSACARNSANSETWNWLIFAIRAILSGSLPWCVSGWCGSETPISG